jgi:hypothetical protein
MGCVWDSNQNLLQMLRRRLSLHLGGTRCDHLAGMQIERAKEVDLVSSRVSTDDGRLTTMTSLTG